MLDVLIKNANIIDGTGKPAYKGSIGTVSYTHLTLPTTELV